MIDDSTEDGTHWERISETEAKEIQAAYVPMPDYDMTPLTEFLNHGAQSAAAHPKGNAAALFSLFGWLYSRSTSSSQILPLASLGIRQSPRGLRQTEPTFTPSGRQLRLNC